MPPLVTSICEFLSHDTLFVTNQRVRGTKAIKSQTEAVQFYILYAIRYPVEIPLSAPSSSSGVPFDTRQFFGTSQCFRSDAPILSILSCHRHCATHLED